LAPRERELVSSTGPFLDLLMVPVAEQYHHMEAISERRFESGVVHLGFRVTAMRQRSINNTGESS
jgi:hypothetical protein